MTKRSDFELSRRSFLEGAVAISAAVFLPARGAWSGEGEYQLGEAAEKAIAKSPLIYITPLGKDGSESACHAEVWFASDGQDLLVCTPQDAWRSQAVKRGLDRARIWVGDFGPWMESDGKYKVGPTLVARSSLLPAGDAAVERALAVMGEKYASSGWSKWGPRFRSGLEDGSRVMIRYRPFAA